MSSPRRPGADAPARLADVETLRRLTRDAFETCVSKLRAFAAALLACFPLDDARADDTRAAFPELFA